MNDTLIALMKATLYMYNISLDIYGYFLENKTQECKSIISQFACKILMKRTIQWLGQYIYQLSSNVHAFKRSNGNPILSVLFFREKQGSFQCKLQFDYHIW